MPVLENVEAVSFVCAVDAAMETKPTLAKIVANKYKVKLGPRR